MSIINKVKEMLGRHTDKAHDAVDKAGDMFDRRTGGKYADKVDKAQDQAHRYAEQQRRGDVPPPV